MLKWAWLIRSKGRPSVYCRPRHSHRKYKEGDIYIECDNCGHRLEEGDIDLEDEEMFLEKRINNANFITNWPECQAEVFIDTNTMTSKRVTGIELSDCLLEREE